MKSILKYGVIAGLVVGGILFGFTVSLEGKMPMGAVGMAIGYASMLLARMASRHPVLQMPPLGTRVVDEDAVALLRRWIAEDTTHAPTRAATR